MNFAACPDDGTHPKAAAGRPEPGQPLLLRCPAFLTQFQLTDSGVIEMAAGPGELET